MAEFKLIIVKNNEIAGNFVFHYAPCHTGCPVRLRDYEVVFEDDFGQKLPDNIFDEVSQEQLETFMKQASRQLIKHLNKIGERSSDN